MYLNFKYGDCFTFFLLKTSSTGREGQVDFLIFIFFKDVFGYYIVSIYSVIIQETHFMHKSPNEHFSFKNCIVYFCCNIIIISYTVVTKKCNFCTVANDWGRGYRVHALYIKKRFLAQYIDCTNKNISTLIFKMMLGGGGARPLG